MSNKKTRQESPDGKNQEELRPEENLPEEYAEPENNKEENRALETFEKQLAEAQAQAAEYKDGWQRSVADFQNYKRRVDAERAETYQMATANIVKRYLPIMDDLERALAEKPQGLSWTEGIELIYRKLQTILDAEGLKKIDAMGRIFDPNLHEAISQEPVEGKQSGEVIDVIRNGYMLGDRVIRPALVRVAK